MTQDEFQKQVINSLDRLTGDVEKLTGDVEKLTGDVEKLTGDVEKLDRDSERYNDRFSNYQQATQSLVNLAFGLIASATVITVVSAVFKR